MVHWILPYDDYDELIELMHHDKKNQNGIINFTMLGGIGDIRINQTATTEEDQGSTRRRRIIQLKNISSESFKNGR